MITEFLSNVPVYWRPVFEISVFWCAYYLLLVYIKDSGMMQALKGLAFLAILFFISNALEMKTVRWILAHLFQISILGFIIVFHPELRRGLTRIGQSPLFRIFLKEQRVLDEIIKSVVTMSKNRVGALIAIEREVNLKSYTETGITLDAALSSELLMTVFMPVTPFHDGGVVIQGGRLIAASCVFPLSQSQTLSKSLGTRHRAALGLSEETDALVIVVSEETGIISAMSRGRIERELDEKGLQKYLYELYEADNKERRRRIRFKKAKS